MASKKKAGFGPVVARALKEAGSPFELLETTTGGNAPIVMFGVRSAKGPTAIIDAIAFQKGQWEQTDFCVENYIVAYGPKRGGGSRLYHLHRSARFAMKANHQFHKYTDEASLSRVVTELAPRLDEWRKKNAKPYVDAYPRTEKLLAKLPKLYVAYCGKKRTRPPAERREDDLERTPGELEFERELVAKGHLTAGDVRLKDRSIARTAVHQFWLCDRPQRKDEADLYLKDHYDCFRCGKWSLLRKVVSSDDPVFGSHYGAICKKCSERR
jgi:hypothetical protein